MKKIFTLLCVTLSSFAAMADGVEVNGIYYLLDSDDMTASVTYMGADCYSGNNYAGSIVIPDMVVYSENKYAVTSIGERAFYNCNSLTSVTIPKSVTTIEFGAFEYCIDLTSVEIPSSVTTIGCWAFEGCYNLTSINIPNKVTSIEGGVFSTCISLTSIHIPNSIKSIGMGSFSVCTQLSSIVIPSSVISIGDTAFSNCSALQSITCMAIDPPSLGEDVFYNVPRNIPLYVPASSIPAYQAAEQWNEFDIQPLLVDIDPIAPDTTQLSWLPVDSASLYKLRIYSEQIELDTTLLIEADSLNGGIRIPVTLAPNRDKRMPMDDIGSVIIIIIEPRSGITTETPFVVTVSTTSKDKIDVGFDLKVFKGETTIKQESGSFTFNAPIPDGLEGLTVDNAQCTMKKMIIDNQLFIFRGDKIYNAAGGLIK